MADEVIRDHPVAILENVLGTVDDLSGYYEYQLYARGLATSSAFNMRVRAIREPPLDLHHQQDRTTSHTSIISVDPPGCRDVDDAFSIQNGVLSIYIANVGMVLQTLGLLEPDLFERTASVYLPDGVRAMLPKRLSEDWCSLLEGQSRQALVCDISLDTGEAIFTTALIRVQKNWTYDDYERTQDYLTVREVVRKLNRRFKILDSVDDSHDVVAWMMVAFSHHAAQRLECGMFRGVQVNGDVPPADVVLRPFLRGWNSTGGHYSTEPVPHDMLGLQRYVHITSPIRRLPDLVNGLLLQQHLGLLPATKTEFTDSWLERVDDVNAQQRQIRRAQIECELLHAAQSIDEDQEFDGYVVDTMDDDRRLVVVWLPELKLVATYRTNIDDRFALYQRHRFVIRHFRSESTFKKKIRLVLKD